MHVQANFTLPWFHTLTPHFREWTNDELSSISKQTGVNYSFGFKYDTVMTNAPIYLKYLLSNFQRDGGEVIIETVASLSSLVHRYPHVITIINCTGLGARELCGDERVYACRGQVIIVRNDEIKEIMRVNEDPPTYILPRGDGTVVIGGTYQHGER